jgi:hypothetical protein
MATNPAGCTPRVPPRVSGLMPRIATAAASNRLPRPIGRPATRGRS